MKQTKWTPGPWRLMPPGHDGIAALQIWSEKDGESRLCTIMKGQEKNAGILVAAPDLYDGLDNLLTLIEGVDAIYDVKQFQWLYGKPSYKAALAALAKARGRVLQVTPQHRYQNRPS